jgi:capsular polysaccharide biosynthesis protein
MFAFDEPTIIFALVFTTVIIAILSFNYMADNYINSTETFVNFNRKMMPNPRKGDNFIYKGRI